MTEEQIVELPITVFAAMVDSSEYALRLLALSAVGRLLEERKRLLAALKDMASDGHWSRYGDAAIAYAEEAAP